MPDQPEALGLVALMLYLESRRVARRDAEGEFVPLESQDTTRWDHAMLGEAEQLLQQAAACKPMGRYQLEAAMQSAHAARRLGSATNWPAIVALYSALGDMTGSPIVVINRAVAIAHAAYQQSIGLEIDPAVRRFLQRRAAAG